mmetsp:Transcript_80490/g.239878  ORF Transcript_80490/g.239878 Transcript_80490/m.239878 type:complete len:301 (-) Transcript_80490:458-1360(-)
MSSCDSACAISPPTIARKRCRSCRTTVSTSGVARTSGASAPSGPPGRAIGTLKARSPKERERWRSSPASPRSAGRPWGPCSTTVPSMARMRLRSAGMAGECVGVRRERSSRPSSAFSPNRAAASPRFVMKRRWPRNIAITALQPSLALPLERNSASRSLQLSRSADAICESPQGPLNSESRGRSFRCRFRATNSAHVGGAGSSVPSVEPAEPWLWSAPPVAVDTTGRWPLYTAKSAAGRGRWSIGMRRACAAFARSRMITCRSSRGQPGRCRQEASTLTRNSFSMDAAWRISVYCLEASL